MAGSPLLALLAGAASIPTLVAQRKQRLQEQATYNADQQAILQGDQEKAKQAQFATKAAGMNLGYQMAGRYRDMTIAHPELINDAKFNGKVVSDLQSTGFPVSFKDGPNGQIPDFDSMVQRPPLDAAALQQIKATQPGSPMRKAVVSLYDPGSFPPGLDPNAIPFEPTLSAGALSNVQKQMEQIVAAVSAGKQRPSALVNFITSERNVLTNQLGMDPRGLDAYLDPQWQRNAISQYAQTQIQSMVQAGIIKGDNQRSLDSMRNAITNLDQARITQGNRALDIKQQQANTSAQRMVTQANTAAATLNYKMQELQRQTMTDNARINLETNRLAWSQANSTVTQATRIYTSLQSQLTSLRRTASNIAAQGGVPDQSIIDALNPQNNGSTQDENGNTVPASLANQVEMAKQQLDAAKQALSSSRYAGVTAASGFHTRPATPNPPAEEPATMQLHGKPIVVRNGRWVYQDTGLPAQ